MSWSHRYAFPGGCLAAFCLAVLAGCGGSEGCPRLQLEGTVTLDGKPLTEGHIRFIPIPDTERAMVGAKISEGRFVIPAEKGALPGKFRVEIGSSRKTGRKVPGGVMGELTDEYVQFLPERYNSQSHLTAEVTASGPNRFEFALKSK